jgi:hypothetical protein
MNPNTMLFTGAVVALFIVFTIGICYLSDN